MTEPHQLIGKWKSYLFSFLYCTLRLIYYEFIGFIIFILFAIGLVLKLLCFFNLRRLDFLIKGFILIKIFHLSHIYISYIVA